MYNDFVKLLHEFFFVSALDWLGLKFPLCCRITVYTVILCVLDTHFFVGLGAKYDEDAHIASINPLGCFKKPPQCPIIITSMVLQWPLKYRILELANLDMCNILEILS